MASERLLREANFTNATKYYVTSTAVAIGCTVVGIPFLIFVLPLVWIAKSVEYKNIRCELYERSLKVHRGWLNKIEKTIPLEKITDLAVNQGPIMRMIGVEGILVETAGQSNLAGASVNLVGIQDARGFRDAVLAQRDRMMGVHDGEDTPTPGRARTTGPDADADTLTEIRDILVRIEERLNANNS